MKTTLYALVKNNKTGMCGFRPVDGEIMKIGEFNCGIYQTFRMLEGKTRKKWFVIELESGVAISSGDTKKETMGYARLKVKHTHPLMLKGIFARHIEEFGRSPRYQEGMRLD